MLWALFTIVAAAAQTFRNATQRGLTARVGTMGATLVRFLFGLPFACLFLAGVSAATSLTPPIPGAANFAWIAMGGLFQIAATALMLAAMRARSFVVTIAYTKTEPVQAAVFALMFLGERPTPWSVGAILVATAGVQLMSWPKKAGPDEARAAWTPALLGLGAGACFALSAVGFRGGVLRLETPSFVMAATTALVLGLALQTALMTAWFALFDRAALAKVAQAWRPSLFAGLMGALASQFWFLAFALTSVANVRTLGLVEMIFAQILSRRMFKQGASGREAAGMGLILTGLAALLSG